MAVLFGSGRKLTRKIESSLLMALLASQILLAQQGGVVTGGAASIDRSGGVTNINQSTEKASINWQSFSIRPEETVNFNQPGVSSIALNRVIGNETSVLEGALNANGKVFLLNSNGVLFTKGSVVNTAGFLASTLNLTDEDFRAGRYVFKGDGARGSIVNQGAITAREGGYVALLGNAVSNQGIISATKGTVALASGEKISLSFNGDSLFGVTVDEGTLDALVENKAAVVADGGRVFLTAKAAHELVSAQVNTSGIIQAQTIDDIKGSIELNAHGGTANAAGTLDASAPNGGDGGFIETSGERVKIADNVVINTKAANGANGEWLIDPDGFTIGTNSADGDLAAATLNAALANGNVTIASTDGSGSDGIIDIYGAVSWSANTLTLNATNNIFVNNTMTASGTAGLTANYGTGVNADETPRGLYTLRDVSANPTSKIDFSGTGELRLGGQTYTVINNMDQLSAARNNPAGRYALGSHIPFSSATWIPLDNNSASGFTGVFNGLGHRINTFDSSATSLFGTVGSGGVISNLSIGAGTVWADSASSKTSVGMLAAVNRGMVVNSGSGGGIYVTDAANPTTNITAAGGLVGVNYGLIARSFSNVNAKGVANTTGGLVGVNESTGRIIESDASGSIFNTDVSSPTTGYVGGLVGINNGIILRSPSTSKIVLDGATAATLITGGFVGKNAGTIQESYAIGEYSTSTSANQLVTAPRFGGFVGENAGTIGDAYTTLLSSANISSNWDAGFAYRNSGTIRNAYTSVNSRNSNGPRYGFAYENIGTIENAYWAMRMRTGSAEPALTPGTTYLTQDEAKNFANYHFGSGMSDVWASAMSGMPILKNLPVYVRATTGKTYGTATSKVSTLGLVATGLQGDGGIVGAVDSITTDGRNPFTVATNNGYVDAGVWNASDILTGSPYTNIRGSVKINPKTLTVSGTAAVGDKVYDGTTAAVLIGGIGLSGLVGAQTLNLSYTASTFRDKNVGNGKTVDIAFTATAGENGGKPSNYTFPAAVTATANITPKPVSIAIAGNDRAYDGTTVATVTGQFSGKIDGDDLGFAYAASFDDKNAGSRTVSVTGISLAGNDAGNYSLNGPNSRSTTASIAPRPLEIVGFSNASGVLQIGAGNLSASNIVEGDAVALGGSVTVAASTVGSQPIVDFSALTVDNPNYTVVGSVGNVVIGGDSNLVFDRVTAGNASLVVSGKTTTVTQTTDKAAIDWLRFSLGASETLVFEQPSASSIVLNRVSTNLQSVIEGALRANGRVFVLNARGVLFAAGSSVNVGGLVASTLNVTNEEFLNSKYVFRVAGSDGSVVAQGDIVIADGGFVALAGNRDVTHTGAISGGNKALFASTDSLMLTLNDTAMTDYAIGNLTGRIAAGGSVNIGSAATGGQMITAGNSVAANDLALNTGKGGAWRWEQNGDIAIGDGAFAGNFVNDNLQVRDLALTSRNGRVTVDSPIDWTADTTLTLNSAKDIPLNKAIRAAGTGSGLTLGYDGGAAHLTSIGSISIGGDSKVSPNRVTGGDVAVDVSGNATIYTPATDKVSIDWTRFSVGAGETLVFAQPSGSSIVLNRVIGDQRSVIDGALNANGRVFILNANGVLFAASSSVNVGGLVASTFNLTNEDFFKNSHVFTVSEGDGSILAEGDIVIADGGFIALASNRDVTHTGATAGGNKALFASTDSLALTLNPDNNTLTDFAIGDLTGTTTASGSVDIGSSTTGGTLVAAGNAVATSGFTLTTGSGGAWHWEQNGAFALGSGPFTREFVTNNLQTRDLSLTTRQGGIAINSAIDWMGDTTLTLNAARDIDFNKSMRATGANAGFAMNYGGEYHLIAPASFSGAVLDANGKPVARQTPPGIEYTSLTLSGANASLKINGNAYTLIHDMDGLAAIDDATGTASGNFALAQDLDAAAWSRTHTGTSSVVASMSGTLAGLGHKVSNLTLNTPAKNSVGLIGSVAANGGARNVLRDIGVVNVSLAGNTAIGALAGGATNATIYRAYSTGDISAEGGTAGGLIGGFGRSAGVDDYALTTGGDQIKESYSGVNIVSKGGYVGGLVGRASVVAIADSHATGDVIATRNTYYVDENGQIIDGVVDGSGQIIDDAYADGAGSIMISLAREVGGLLGSSSYANISNSYATGDVTSLGGEQVGGLIGNITGLSKSVAFHNGVFNSFATGNVIGGFKVGGLVGELGYLLSDDSNPMTVDNSYATGNVTGNFESNSVVGGGMIGGLIGSAGYSNISNSHATGVVTTTTVNRSDNMGGLVGRQKGGSISDSYATGTVIGNGGSLTGGLVGGGNGTVAGSYYVDSRVETAAKMAPVRSETGRIVGEVRLDESEGVRNEIRNGTGNGISAARRGNRQSLLDQYIYFDDSDSYSARVKAISVEESDSDQGEDDEEGKK